MGSLHDLDRPQSQYKLLEALGELKKEETVEITQKYLVKKYSFQESFPKKQWSTVLSYKVQKCIILLTEKQAIVC